MRRLDITRQWFKPITSLALLLPLAFVACDVRSRSASPTGSDEGIGEALFTASPPVWFEGYSTPAYVSLDGRLAIAGSLSSGDLRLVDLASKRDLTDSLRAGMDAVSLTVFGPNGALVVLGNALGKRGWFLKTPEGPRALDVPAGALPRWSPDGSRIALYMRATPDSGLTVVDGSNQRHIPIAGAITTLGWMPDGNGLLVLASDTSGLSTLYRVNGDGSALQALASGLDAKVSGRDAPLAVSSDGKHTYLALASTGAPDRTARHQPVNDRDLDIYEIELATGNKRAVVATSAEEFAPALVNGELYWTVTTLDMSVVVLPMAGGPARVVVKDAMLPTWRPDGRMLGFTVGQWRVADWALNWDGVVVDVDANARATSNPRPYIAGYHEDFSPVWSPKGRWIAYHSHRAPGPVAQYSSAGSTDDIYLRGADSTLEIRLTDFGLEVGSPSWAPDGRRLVFTGWLGGPSGSAAWITSIDTTSGRALNNQMITLPTTIGGANNARWSPVADVIAVAAPLPEGRQALWTIRPDGSAIRKVAEYALLTYGDVDWTRDGARLVFPAIDNGRMQLFSVSVDGGAPQKLSNDNANLLHPSVSPDGRWIAATRIAHRRELRRMELR